MPAVLTAEVETARWFEALLAERRRADQAQRAANWVTSELFGALNRLGKDIEDSPVTPAQAAELLGLVADGTISGTLAKQVFEIMLETGEDPGDDRRGARAQADQRHRRDRGGDRQGPRRERRTRSPNIAAARRRCSASSSARR